MDYVDHNNIDLNQNNHQLPHIDHFDEIEQYQEQSVYEEQEQEQEQGEGEEGEEMEEQQQLDNYLNDNNSIEIEKDSLDNIEFDQDDDYHKMMIEKDNINTDDEEGEEEEEEESGLFNLFNQDEYDNRKEKDENTKEEEEESNKIGLSNSSSNNNNIYQYQQQQQQQQRGYSISCTNLLMNIGLFLIFLAIITVNDQFKNKYIYKDNHHNHHHHQQNYNNDKVIYNEKIQQQQQPSSEYYLNLLKRETDLKDLIEKYETSNKLGDLDQSLSALYSMIRLSPRYCGALFRIGQLLNIKTQVQEAENMYIKALECERWLRLEYIIELVLFYNSKGRYQESYALSSRAILFFPNDYHLNKIYNTTKDIILNIHYGDVSLDYQGRLLPYFSAIE